jgi:hypothetical protein
MTNEITQRRQIIGDLAVVLHQALRGPGYLPIRPRDAVMRLQEDLGIADGAEPDEIESRLTAALAEQAYESIGALIEASSLGTPGARKLRERGRQIAENRGKASST